MAQTKQEMIPLECGGCQRSLRIAASLRGRRIQCPKCKTIVLVPGPEVESDSDEAGFPEWLAIFLGSVFLFMFGGLLSVAIGMFASILICLTVGSLSLIIWKREQLVSYIDQWKRKAQRKASAKPSTPRSTPPKWESTRETSEPSVALDDLFELQTESVAAPRVSSASSESTTLGNVSRWLHGASETDVKFFGPSTVATVDGCKLESPLIYLVDGKLRDSFDASLIETGLTVASSGRGADELPYWPNYRQCSPEQRRIYLDWLTSGRRDPDVELGYVFIYFYGLERRVVLDRTDFEVVIHELLELLPIYNYSRSFQRYSSGLLWMAALCAAETDQLSDKLLDQVISATDHWSEENLSALLSLYQKRGLPVPPKVAFIATEQDSRSPRSVVFKRHPEKFQELFFSRYADSFENGLRLKAAKRDFSFDYRPASSSLIGFGDRSSRVRLNLPNTLGLPSQFKPLIEIWSDVVEDLRAFDRAHKKSDDDQGMTAEMYEALPAELRDEDHPDFEIWYHIIDRYTDDTGVAFVPVSEFAKTRGISERSRLTKKQCGQILNSADCMDLCLEPDARETGQNYQWDGFVSVFPRESDEHDNLKSYHAASILLRLGMSIAAADGSVDDEEMELITAHLEQQFELSQQESIRLEHLGLLLARHPPDDSRLGKKLQELPDEQRNMIGDLLVAIAAADDIITPEESKALRKAFRNLNLDPARIDRLAEGVVQVDDGSGSAEELVLNHDRIREIMFETSQVAEFLQNVMVEDQSEEDYAPETGCEPTVKFEAVTATATDSDSTGGTGAKPTDSVLQSTTASEIDCAGLDKRYHSFLKVVLSRPEWPLAELEILARTHSLMLNGAIEAINEWSLDSLGDWLIDDSGSTVLVSTELVHVTRTT